jgi:hypothetical protein
LVPNENNEEKEVNISQYADDSTIILGDALDTDQALHIVKKFGKVAGLKLNLKKTIGIPLGEDRTKMRQLSKSIEWTEEPVKMLGIYVGNNDEECERLNWDAKILNIEKVLNMWKQRNITLLGKIIIIKSLAIPKIIYAASILCTPHYIIKQVQQLLYKFIWKSKDKIKRTYIINSVEDGGLSMIDIELQCEALKAVWLNRILQDNQNSWTRLPKYYLNKVGLDLV